MGFKLLIATIQQTTDEMKSLEVAAANAAQSVKKLSDQTLAGGGSTLTPEVAGGMSMPGMLSLRVGVNKGGKGGAAGKAGAAGAGGAGAAGAGGPESNYDRLQRLTQGDNRFLSYGSSGQEGIGPGAIASLLRQFENAKKTNDVMQQTKLENIFNMLRLYLLGFGQTLQQISNSQNTDYYSNFRRGKI